MELETIIWECVASFGVGFASGIQLDRTIGFNKEVIENNLNMLSINENSYFATKKTKRIAKTLKKNISGIKKAESLMFFSAFYLLNTIQYNSQNILTSAIIGLSNYGGQTWGTIVSKLLRNHQKLTPKDTKIINEYISEVNNNIVKNGWLNPEKNYLEKLKKVYELFSKRKNISLAKKFKKMFNKTVSYANTYYLIKKTFELKEGELASMSYFIDFKNNQKTDALIVSDNKLYKTNFDESHVKLKNEPFLPEYLDNQIKTEELNWNKSIDHLTSIVMDYQNKEKNVFFIKSNKDVDFPNLKIAALRFYLESYNAEKNN